MPDKHTIAVIPARFESSRFKGKPLHLITGKSLIQRTYEQACLVPEIDEVIIATDDIRIFEHAQGFNAKVVMTSKTCPTGTDRVIEVVKNYYPDSSIVINIQGDTPVFNPQTVLKMIHLLKNRDSFEVTTAVTPLESKKEINSPHIVKCYFSSMTQKAIFFTRGAPSHRKKTEICKHIGIYCFRKHFLLHYGRLPATPLQQAEDLEQLKILEHGHSIGVVKVNDPVIGVDTPEDVLAVERIICQESISL